MKNKEFKKLLDSMQESVEVLKGKRKDRLKVRRILTKE